MGAAAPPATTMSAASLLPSRCGTRNRASDSGSATVADSPIARICGASCHSRARPSDSRSPRLEVTSACNSSSTMRLSEREQERRVVGRQQQRQLLGRGQQNIRRIAPLPLPPRHRRIAGAGLDLDRRGPSRRSASPDCARYRPRALLAARCRGCGGRGSLHAAAGGDEPREASARSSPLLPRAQRVVGRGRGWGASRSRGGEFADSLADRTR